MTDTQRRLTAALADRYRVERELGAGGMATVYLAHDLKHEREVAIKVLHPDLGAALGAERFLSEIKTTARLQHPHILGLLDSGAADGLLFYVMPFVRGETLRARLVRETQLPVPDALRIAREVADALAAAHEAGVVHRDIKPENILLQGGHALVADFGIALAVQQAGGARMTQTGLSLGTPQYMAPEQAMGDRGVDHRADIYALGAVTYEMLTGEPPHTGANAQAIVAKLLTDVVRPVTLLRPAVPAHVDAALQVALQKLPADRFATVAEFSEALRGGTGARFVSAAGPAAPAAGAGRRGALVVAGVALAVLCTAGGWLLGRGRPRAEPGLAGATRFALEMAVGLRYPATLTPMFAVSPQGDVIVFAGIALNGGMRLYRRPMNSLDAEPMQGTDDAVNPVFSPDGRWVAYGARDQLWKIPLEGGSPVRLASASTSSLRGIAWTQGNTVVWGTNADSTLMTVSANGGEVRRLFRVPPGTPIGATPRWPVAIPGRDEILYSLFFPGASDAKVFAVPLTGDAEPRPVGNNAWFPVGVLGDEFLYVTREAQLMSAPWDARTRTASGSATQLVSLATNVGTGLAYVALSASGDLIYRDGTSASQLVLVDRTGLARPVTADTLAFATPRLSPDQQRVAVAVNRGSTIAVAVVDRANGILTWLAADLGDSQADRPEWSPDGRRVLYRVNERTGSGFGVREADLSAPPRRLATPKVSSINELVMAPDGRTMLARGIPPGKAGQDLLWWTDGDSAVHAFILAPGIETGPRFSPDGRWAAYSSDGDAGRNVFITPFPGPGPRVQVSPDGGSGPVWSRDGKALYFVRAGRIFEVPLTFNGGVRVGGARAVLDGPYQLEETLHAPYDVTSDGQFLVVRPVREARTVILRNVGAEIRWLRTRQEGR